MNSLSIFQRLMVTATVFLVLLGLIVGFSIFQVRGVSDILQHVNNINSVKQRYAINFRGSVHDRAIAMRDVTLITDEPALKKRLADIDLLAAKYADSANKMDDLFQANADTVSDDEKRLLADIKAREAIALPMLAKVIATREQGQFREAQKLVLDEGAQPFVNWLAATNHLIDHEEALNKTESAVVTGIVGRFGWLMLMALSVVGVLIMAVMAQTGRGLKKVLGGEPAEVADVTKKVATGDFSTHIPLASGDTTSLFANVAKMQESLKEASIKALDSIARIDAINSAQAVIEFEMDGTVVTANDIFLKATGYRLDEVKGKNHSMFVEPGYRQSAEYKEFWDALRRGENQVSQCKRIGANGREIWLQASYNTLYQDGKPYKVIKYATDVTDQARMKKGLDDATLQQARAKQVLDDAVTETQAVVQSAIAGNLVSRIPLQGKTGEIAELCQGINALLEATMTLITSVRAAAEQVQSGAQEISRGNTDLSQRTEHQASSLEETAASMEEMTAAVKNNADNAAQANQLALAARDQAEQGGAVVQSAVRAMSEINGSSKKISDIIGVIDDIAFQTNLLALNAAVEAARAGEQGRGFAVVASEVRNLASRSAAAAKEIKGLIQESVSKVEDGTKLVDASGKVLQDIVSGVKKVTDVVAEIAASSQEQASGIEQVNKAVMSMDEGTQQNAALVEQATAAAQSLNEQAANLTQMIARFQIGSESAQAPAARATPARGPSRAAPERRGPNRAFAKAAAKPAVTSVAAQASAASGGGNSEWQEF